MRPLLSAAVKIIFLIAVSSPPAPLSPTNLRCEYRVDPLAIEEVFPRLSWELRLSDPAARGDQRREHPIAH
jgi:hypothetical protein